MNVQYAMFEGEIYVLEVNPRASRTVPFVSKATGVPLAKIAAKVMGGKTLEELGITTDLEVNAFFVKSPVFPFAKFPGVDTILSPEMKSTGEVMGCADDFGYAYGKASLAAGVRLPRKGRVFISVNDRDKKNIIDIASSFIQLGFQLVATRGTADVLLKSGIPCEDVYKVNEGRPNVVDLIKSDRIDLLINTPLGRESFFDEQIVRRVATQRNMPCITTLSAARAAARAIQTIQRARVSVKSLQEYHGA
jgi:carbamoyl-phosphate synthase large subunit